MVGTSKISNQTMVNGVFLNYRYMLLNGMRSRWDNYFIRCIYEYYLIICLMNSNMLGIVQLCLAQFGRESCAQSCIHVRQNCHHFNIIYAIEKLSFFYFTKRLFIQQDQTCLDRTVWDGIGMFQSNLMFILDGISFMFLCYVVFVLTLEQTFYKNKTNCIGLYLKEIQCNFFKYFIRENCT